MSSKSIFIMLNYTVTKLVRFFETQCRNYHQAYCLAVLVSCLFSIDFAIVLSLR